MAGEDEQKFLIGQEAAEAVEASHAHARDLLDAAKLIQEGYPHLAFHFAVLALEEIGRGALTVIRASVTTRGDDTESLDDKMEDHVRKLFWALWSPTLSEPVSAEQIDSFRGLARDIHETRKSGLYVDPDGVLPRDAVDPDQVETLISMAEARLGMETSTSWAPADSEQADDVRWFLEATSDRQTREFLFGGGSLKKLSELHDVPAWIRWMRREMEAAQLAADEALSRELERAAPGQEEEEEPKWALRFRLYSPSHSIRPRPLNRWNEVSKWIKLTRATSNELIVDMTLPKIVSMPSLWGSSYALAQRFLLALNIGTMGFFWWSPRTQITGFYEGHVRDLETGLDAGLLRSPPLDIDWGRGNVLNDAAIDRVIVFFGALVRSTPEASVAYGHYLRGLGLIAKTDVHLQFERNAFEEFYVALRDGMKAYGDWDGLTPFSAVLDEFGAEFFTDDRDTYIRASELIEEGKIGELQIGFHEAMMMKLLADAYFSRKLAQIWKDHNASLGPDSPPTDEPSAS